ncbi:MAG: S8 family peptidase [Porticoccaceae bacterium]
MKNLSITLSLVTIIALCGCSSGGGGQNSSGSGTTIPPVITNQDNSIPPWSSFSAQAQDPDDLAALASEFETEEYAGMGALEMINASTAYARGATGDGVTVGVIDSGVYEEHAEFSRGNGDKVTYAGSDYSSDRPRTDEALGHGTIVAGIIAANRDDNNFGSGFKMHGVAFDASISTFEIPLGSGGGPYQPLDVDDINFSTDSYFAERFTNMANQAQIVNMSFGFSGVITDYSAADIESAFSASLDALRQFNKPRGDRSIFVIAAGNAWNDLDEFGNVVDASSPELLPGIPYLFPELKDHVLAVAAVDSSGEISFYSNRCGAAADFCLSAPGGGDANNDGDFDENEIIWGPSPPPPDGEPDSDYYAGTLGTSFAAPLVSGSLALLKQMFPSVGNHELVNRLLVTANKTGVYSDSSIYGQGLLDLDTATRPVGSTAVASGANLDSGLAPLSDSSISTFGGALGNSLQSALGNHSMAVFDELGFPFMQSASVLIGNSTGSSKAPALRHRTEQLEGGSRIQLGATIDHWQHNSPGFYSGNPGEQIPPDYFALQAQNSSGGERFAGINANPGWFFGIYADSFISPAATNDDSSFAAPWLRFARNGWSSGGAVALGDGKLRMGVFEGSASWNRFQPVSEHRGNGAMMEYSLTVNNQALGLSIQSGFVNERDTFLGTELGRALGQLENSETYFAGINGHLQIRENWQGLFALYSGTTDSGLEQGTDSGLLDLDNSIASSSWSLGLSGQSVWQQNDQLSVYLAQPLRIDRGQASLQLASGRTVDRRVIYQTVAIDLQPQGREQQLEMNYQFAWGRATASARAEYIHQPNHNYQNSSYSEISFSLHMPIGR